MKTLLQLANEWVEQYAFQVPYNGKGPMANEEYYDKERLKHGMAGFIAGYEAVQQQISDKDKEIKELTGKVEFYRVETSKLRDYCETNKIGKPNQKLFDALYDHVNSLQQENETLKAELKEMAFAGIEPGLLDKPINIPATQKNKELRLALADKDKEIAELVRDMRAILQRSDYHSAIWVIATDALNKYPAP